MLPRERLSVSRPQLSIEIRMHKKRSAHRRLQRPGSGPVRVAVRLSDVRANKQQSHFCALWIENEIVLRIHVTPTSRGLLQPARCRACVDPLDAWYTYSIRPLALPGPARPCPFTVHTSMHTPHKISPLSSTLFLRSGLHEKSRCRIRRDARERAVSATP